MRKSKFEEIGRSVARLLKLKDGDTIQVRYNPALPDHALVVKVEE